MNYKEIYWKLYDEGEHVELINRINEVMYEQMMGLGCPVLWELLEGLNPTSDMKVIFLDCDEEIEDEFGSISGLMDCVRHHDLDLTKNFIVKCDSDYQSVDAICELGIDWGQVFDDALEEELWYYLPSDEDEESYKVLEGLFAEAAFIVYGSKIYTTYAKDTDMTFVMKETEKTVECIGWYYGEPNETSTSMFSDSKMIAYK